MEISHRDCVSKKEEEDGCRATVQIWKYIFGFVDMAIVKCAIELKIAETIESRGSPMTLSQLSSALNCYPSLLYRILRFLVRRGIFKEETTAENLTSYAPTPLSRLLTTNGERNLGVFVMLESSPTMLAPWHNLSAYIKGSEVSPFEATHGKNLWGYIADNPTYNALFNESMACTTRVVTFPAILEGCREIFDGVGSLVDVGGGNGTCLSMLVKACPWIKGINFDLPHVISVSPQHKGVQHIGGNMFDAVPNADVVFIMEVLHDWNDEKCIKILKNCIAAVPKETGKVIIVEVVIDEKEENESLSDLRLAMDMVMMAHTNEGKERTSEEWGYILHEAGFSRYTITPIGTIQSVIQGFP